MAKRVKRLKTAIESYKNQIEEHFKKLENDLKDDNEIMAKYHIKEINNSFIAALKNKLLLLGEENNELIENYKKRLQEYNRRLGIE